MPVGDQDSTTFPRPLPFWWHERPVKLETLGGSNPARNTAFPANAHVAWESSRFSKSPMHLWRAELLDCFHFNAHVLELPTVSMGSADRIGKYPTCAGAVPSPTCRLR
jgi:hypothetical protein